MSSTDYALCVTINRENIANINKTQLLGIFLHTLFTFGYSFRLILVIITFIRTNHGVLADASALYCKLQYLYGVKSAIVCPSIKGTLYHGTHYIDSTLSFSGH